MAMSIRDWLEKDRQPADLYELLGRPRFDPDREQLLAAVRAAYAELLIYQNHEDRDVAQRAVELLKELGRAEGVLHDPAKLRAHHEAILNRLCEAYAREKGDQGEWSLGRLRSWLWREQSVHLEYLERVGVALLSPGDKTIDFGSAETQKREPVVEEPSPEERAAYIEELSPFPDALAASDPQGQVQAGVCQLCGKGFSADPGQVKDVKGRCYHRSCYEAERQRRQSQHPTAMGSASKAPVTQVGEHRYTSPHSERAGGVLDEESVGPTQRARGQNAEHAWWEEELADTSVSAEGLTGPSLKLHRRNRRYGTHRLWKLASSRVVVYGSLFLLVVFLVYSYLLPVMVASWKASMGRMQEMDEAMRKEAERVGKLASSETDRSKSDRAESSATAAPAIPPPQNIEIAEAYTAESLPSADPWKSRKELTGQARKRGLVFLVLKVRIPFNMVDAGSTPERWNWEMEGRAIKLITRDGVVLTPKMSEMSGSSMTGFFEGVPTGGSGPGSRPSHLDESYCFVIPKTDIHAGGLHFQYKNYPPVALTVPLGSHR